MKREGSTAVQALVALVIGLLVLDMAWGVARFATTRAGMTDTALDRAREQDRIVRRIHADLTAAVRVGVSPRGGLELSVVDPAWTPTSLEVPTVAVDWSFDGTTGLLKRRTSTATEDLGLHQLARATLVAASDASSVTLTLEWIDSPRLPTVIELPSRLAATGGLAQWNAAVQSSRFHGESGACDAIKDRPCHARTSIATPRSPTDS